MIATTIINSISVKPRARFFDGTLVVMFDLPSTKSTLGKKKAARRRLHQQTELQRASRSNVLGVNALGLACPSTVQSTRPSNSARASLQRSRSAITKRSHNGGCSCGGQYHLRNVRASGERGNRGGCVTTASLKIRTGCLGITIAGGGRVANSRLPVQQACFNCRFQRTRFRNDTLNLRLRHIRLVLRNRDSSQDTNDRHNDHQLDQGETLLHIACDGTTVHSLTPGWFVKPGNQPGAQYLLQHLCHPVSPPALTESVTFVHLGVTPSDTTCFKMLQAVTNLSCRTGGKLRKSGPHPPSASEYPAAPTPPPGALPGSRSGS